MHGDGASAVRVRLFGALGAETGGLAVEITSVAQRRILGRLALGVAEVISIDALVDLLWPDDPPRTAVASVQSQVYRLRLVLGADAIRTTAPGYVLDVDRDTVDCPRVLLGRGNVTGGQL